MPSPSRSLALTRGPSHSMLSHETPSAFSARLYSHECTCSGYHIHSEATTLDYYIKNKDNSAYDGWCWPGSSGWLDFLDPKIRSWWSDQFMFDKYQGIIHCLLLPQCCNVRCSIVIKIIVFSCNT